MTDQHPQRPQRRDTYGYGPYDLRWHTTAYGPYVCDIGLGVGLVKVSSHSSKALPFCPAVARLDPKQDTEMHEWVRQSGGQSTGGLYPDIPICTELTREGREWSPHSLRTDYRMGNVGVAQEIVVTRDGVHCRIDAASPLPLQLHGMSYGPCKIRRLPDGLHVVEKSHRLCPLEYVIRFTTPPARITCNGQEIEGTVFVNHTEQPRWTFCWDGGIETLEFSTIVRRAFAEGGWAETHAPLPSFFDHLHAQAAEWDNYFTQDVPTLETPEPRLDELSRYLAWVFRSNTLHHGGILPYPYSIPKYTFTGWWMWDTAKSSIAGSWYGQREIAWGGMLNTENLQYPAPHEDAGVIANSARWHGVDVWHSPDAASDRYSTMLYMIPEKHGSGTHPPMFALALWSLWSVDGNAALMTRLLPNVLAFDAYFDRMRASKTAPGLILVRRWSDSGMDNSKRWANQNNRALSGRAHYDDTDWEMPVIGVDVNVYSIVEKQCLAAMCRAAGLTAEADRLATQAAERERALHRELWDAERGLYVDRDEARGRFISAIAPTCLEPLMLKGLPEERVEPLLRWLFDPKHFWSDYPIPSISMSDPDFEPERGYWMGPVWMSYPMDILRGLFRHRPEAAHKLLDRLLNLMLRNGVPAVNENYNPLNGQPLECPNFSWNGQLVDIVLRDMLGIGVVDGKVTATSAGVPDDWDHWTVRNVTLHGKRYTIEARKDGGVWRHDIRAE